MDILKDPNRVGDKDVTRCIDSDDRLKSRQFVPSNDPKGKIKFTKSISLN